MALLGFSRTTWLLLILTDLMLTVFLDIPSLITGVFTGGLGLIAVVFFYFILFVFAAIGFSLFEALSGKGAGQAFMNGIIASLLLVIPFPVAPLLGYLSASTKRAAPILSVTLVLLMVGPVFAQVSPSLSPVQVSGLSFWEAYAEWVSYRIYEVDSAFISDFRIGFLRFVNSRLEERIEELNTLSLLFSQGLSSPDTGRIYDSLARDVSYSRYLSSLIGQSRPNLAYESSQYVSVATSLASSLVPLVTDTDVSRPMAIAQTVSTSAPSNVDVSGLSTVLILLTLICMFGAVVAGALSG